ncbi:hypothetical protein Ahy_A03g012851 [Arachis hypogaea]|uniref:Putative plant transposon protein domain-containing protein n=1 Tax=Arachis hypogaea TaxID=3818 RepID=A0A445DUE0_ARAHY|nr:hypothetical protein Ahy_A03g012851 [Arachis hypogaea]
MDKPPNYDQIIQDICVPGVNWERGPKRKPNFIKRGDLLREAKGWFEIVRRSILLAGNNSEVNLKRATMLQCIMKGGEIKVHEIIAQGIQKFAEKSDSGGKLGYPSTIFLLCRLARVIFEDANPVWVTVGLPITYRRMHAAAAPLPPRKRRKRPALRTEEEQPLQEQPPATLSMYQLKEAIDALSRQCMENQEAQRELQIQSRDRHEESLSRWMNQQGEWQKQLMDQHLEQGRQWSESFHNLNQKHDQQQEAIQRLINIQAHQGVHIHEMHMKQREQADLLDELKIFSEGVCMSETGYHVNTQARLGYLVGQLPNLHPGITKYEDVKDELARVERERVEQSHESVRKALEDWKLARANRMRGSTSGQSESKNGKGAEENE